jgi:hypothetical protein
MMTRTDFLAFNPAFEDPLVVSFINLARSQGYASEISFGFWDFFVYDHDDQPQIALKTVKNAISDHVMAQLTVERTPMKVLLLEGGTPHLDQLEGQKLYLAATGTGVFVRNVGWITLPGTPLAPHVHDLQLKLAKRWSQDENGQWRKACTKCGEFKTPEGFYRSAYRTARDPYRNVCIECFRLPPKEEEP